MKLQVLIVLLGLILVGKATADTVPFVTNTLPGYNGTLPFDLETGYIGVGGGVKQLFYYFVKSERDPTKDPLLVWVSGGPGFSSLWGFFYIHGPLNFDLSYPFDGTLPKLIDNEYTWTKFMNILYIDGPAGTGFSYANTAKAYNTSNYKFAADLTKFIHKWLASHESYRSNPAYLSGDGYSGNVIPLAVQKLQKDNEARKLAKVNVGGYLLIAPATNFTNDFNLRYEFARRVGFIPDKEFETANQSCEGNFLTPLNALCSAQVEKLRTWIKYINRAHILEPACGGDTQLTPIAPEASPSFESHLKLPTESDDQPQAKDPPSPWCRKYNHEICNVWVNYNGVEDALGVIPGKKPSPWVLYNETVDKVSFDKDDINDLVPIYQELAKTNIRGLIMSGDHDMVIPHIAIQKCLRALGLPVTDEWRSWSVDINETAGYTGTFGSDIFSVTYVTVKGGGHIIPEYLPRECYRAVANWTDGLPL